MLGVLPVRRFPCPELPPAGAQLSLDAATSHHMLRVVGVAPHQEVLLFTPQGTQARACLVGVEDGRAVVSIQALVEAPPAALAGVWLVQARLKGAAMDTALRMATELGVGHIIVFQARRSVAKGPKLERWRKLAQSAAGQSGRLGLPELQAVDTLQQALSLVPDGVPGFVTDPQAHAAPWPAAPCALLLGPEGGWSPEERALCRAADLGALSLGPHTLRADTAVASALSRVRV